MKVFVTTQFEGMHRWKDAPEQVDFLRSYHRHMFHVRLEVEVVEEDREIEFILLRRELVGLIETLFSGRKMDESCETIAKKIADFMTREKHMCYNRAVKCEVSEDGENGAVVQMTKEGVFL